jgi:P27 family predicted phage terminase small subunit
VAPACPKPPARLKDDARKHWLEVAPELYKVGLLTTIDTPAFTMLCEMWGLYRRSDQAAPDLVYADSNGNVHAHPTYRAMRQFADLWMKLAGEFGMTPRSRVGLQGVMHAPEDELEKFLGKDKDRFFRRDQ